MTLPEGWVGGLEKAMIIGIDARSFFEPAPSPAAHAVLALYDELTRELTTARFVFFYQHNRWRSGWREFADRFREVVNRENVRCECVPLEADIADTWLHVRLPLCARERHLSCLHLPEGIAPTWCPVPMVLNLNPRQVQSALQKRQDGLMLARSWRRAALAGASFVVANQHDASEISGALEIRIGQLFVDAGIHPDGLGESPSESRWPNPLQTQRSKEVWKLSVDAAQIAFSVARQASAHASRIPATME